MLRITDEYIEHLRTDPPAKNLRTKLDSLILKGVASSFLSSFYDLTRLTALWVPSELVAGIKSQLDMSDPDLEEIVVETRVKAPAYDGVKMSNPSIDDRKRNIGDTENIQYAEQEVLSQSRLQMETIRDRMSEIDVEKVLCANNNYFVLATYHEEHAVRTLFVVVNRPSLSVEDRREKFVSLLYVEHKNNPLNKYIISVDELYRQNDLSDIMMSFYQNGLMVDGGKLDMKIGLHTEIPHFNVLSLVQAVECYLIRNGYDKAPNYTMLKDLISGNVPPVEKVMKL